MRNVRCPRKLIALLLLGFLSSLPAYAAPTCQNMQGETTRCGVPGAMPVGWKLPAAEREQIASAHSGDSNPVQGFEALCILGLFFSLLALMPDFDGSQPGDWDVEEDETTRRQ